jgi:hypothetical protein
MMDLVLGLIAVAIVAVAALLLVVRRRKKPRTLPVDYFQKNWRSMQKLCAKKETWHQAIIEADKLLDEALKKKRFTGKSMGARLTKAQHVLTDNEGVWFGHKLRNKVEADPSTKLKEKDIKEALLGIRQALKDLGALPDGR